MWRFRLIRFRLTLAYTLLLTAAFSLFSVGIFVGLHIILYDNFYNKVDSAASTVVKDSKVTATAATYPYFSLNLHVVSETIGGDLNTSTTKYLFLDSNGRPIPGNNSHGDPKLANNPTIQKVVAKSLTQGTKESISLGGTNGNSTLLVYPVQSTTAGQYVLLVQSSFQDVEDTLSLLQRILILTAVTVTLLSGAGAWFLTGRVLRPIDKLADAARRITVRDLSQRLHINQRDEIGRLANTFNEMIARLEASFERQKRFTSDASHELRTPLTVMQADITLALRRPRTSVEYRRTLESAQEEVTRLSQIVGDLLTLARLDTDVAQVAHEPVELDGVIEMVIAGLRPLASEKSIGLTYSIDEPVTIMGDGTRLKQLFINLLDNALTYTPEHGAVRLSLTTEAEVVTVSITDTGIGIAPDYLPHIFERFYRTEEARLRNHEGTGLGLAIAQSAAQAHQGRIDVCSVLGHGTTFNVVLPRDGVFAGQRETSQLSRAPITAAAS